MGLPTLLVVKNFFFVFVCVLLLYVFSSKRGRLKVENKGGAIYVWACVALVGLIPIGYATPIPFALAFGEKEERFNRLKPKRGGDTT